MDPLLREMLRIRRFEEKVSELYMSELSMRCPIHLCNGQEAIAVGVCSHLKKTDWVFPPHRNHHWYLAKGGSMKALAAEMYGKVTGCSGGMGGSMHVVDTGAGISLSSSIVASNIPVAVGAAWSFKMRGTDQIAVVPFGDGALDEGVFWESLNFAMLRELPILFILENNGFATHSPIDSRFFGEIASKIEAYGYRTTTGKYSRISGNDPFKVRDKLEWLFRDYRRHLPAFMHCVVYRWMEHVGPGEDFHLGYRDEAIIRFDQGADVLMRLEDPDIDKEVEEAFEFARFSPFPESCLL